MELHSFLDHEHCGKQLLSDWTKNLVSSTVRFKTTPVGFKECFLNGADIIVDILQIHIETHLCVFQKSCLDRDMWWEGKKSQVHVRLDKLGGWNSFTALHRSDLLFLSQLNSHYCLVITTNSFTAKWMGDWYSLALFSICVNIVFVFLHPFLVESPRWLLTKGRVREAAEIINNIRTFNKQEKIKELESKLKPIAELENKQEKDSLGPLDIFKNLVIFRFSMFVWYSKSIYFLPDCSVWWLSSGLWMTISTSPAHSMLRTYMETSGSTSALWLLLRPQRFSWGHF